MIKTLPLSEVKTQFPRIVKGIEKREEELIVTRNGKPAAIILNYQEFCRLRETVEILTDQDLMKQIRKSKSFFKKKKKGLSFKNIFGEPIKGTD